MFHFRPKSLFLSYFNEAIHFHDHLPFGTVIFIEHDPRNSNSISIYGSHSHYYLLMRLNDLQRRKIFGLSVVISDGLSLINKFIEHLTAHEGASIFFVNAYTLYLKEYDDQFARELCNADYLLNDGIGMELAARVHGVALRENLVGTDLIPRFLSNLSGLQWKPGIFLVGGNEMTARKATDYVRKHFPFLRVAGNQPGYFSKEEFGSLGYKIQMAKPDVVLVGMGQPIQENFIASIREVAPQALLFGVGGLFDYWSNNLKRAPAFVRRLRLEWLHIILRQPYKVNRYIKCIPFVLKRVFLFGMSSILEKMREAARSILRRICTVLAIPVILYRKTTRKPSTCVFVYHHISDEVGVPFTVGISRCSREGTMHSFWQLRVHSFREP